MPFAAGLAAAGQLTAVGMLLAAGFWFVLTLAIEVTNRMSDRVEDAVNRPERTRLCEQVGWRRLALARTALWSLVAAATVGWLVLAPSALLLTLLGLGVAAGVGYSCGPRLARHRAMVFVVLSGTFVGPFALGWAAGATGADWRQLDQFVPLFWVLTLFISSLAGIEDITDRVGDEAIGYPAFGRHDAPIFAIGADNSLADLAPIWHHPVDLAPLAGPEIEEKLQADLRFLVVEPRGLEPLTPCLQSRCATNCAMAPGVSTSRPAGRGGGDRWSGLVDVVGRLGPECLLVLALVDLLLREHAAGGGKRTRRSFFMVLPLEWMESAWWA